ncbi:MAG: hypothetical protein LBG72_05060 [Spirochaetaceae bacterium]|jgi:hypothetical protein|nr:hypothetical protein [Spirochaetaceae bacterium]
MSVRATGALIADLVHVTGISNSPKMVVLSVDETKKTVNTVWFDAQNSAQHAEFPAQALDRVEVKVPAKSRK